MVDTDHWSTVAEVHSPKAQARSGLRLIWLQSCSLPLLREVPVQVWLKIECARGYDGQPSSSDYPRRY